MSETRPPLQEYSPARSALKSVAELGRMAAGVVITASVALAADPAFTERVLAIVAGHPRAVAAVGALVFLGRFLLDYRKHRT